MIDRASGFTTHENEGNALTRCLIIFVLMLGLIPATFGRLVAQDAPKDKPAVAKNYHIVVGRFMRPINGLIARNWDELGSRLQDTLLEKLSDQSVPVVERGALDQVKEELLRSGDIVDPETSVQIGKQTGGTHLLVGRVSFDIKNDVIVYRYVMNLKARLISLRTGKPVGNFEAKAEKKGNYLKVDDHELEHFIESTMDDACEKLAKKVAASPPPMEEGTNEAAGGGASSSGSHVFEGDGQATVQSDEQAARLEARAAAVRDVVMRCAGMFTRSDSQQAVAELISNDTGRYGVIEGAPISEGVTGSLCKSTVHVRIFFTNAPADKLALLTRLKDRGLLQSPKIMVVVPETHIQRRIPDPALETEIARQVSDAGFDVVDAARVKEIREQDWLLAASKGTASATELSRLKADYGADILITGEGISERAEANRVGEAVRCSARAEIKAFRTDNAELLFSDAVPSAQAAGLSEAIVAKAALQNAGKIIAPRIVDALFSKGFGKTTAAPGGGIAQVSGTVFNLKLSGWQSASDVFAFVKALPKVKGVIKVLESPYEASVLTLKVLVEPAVAAEFGFGLADDPAVQRFHLNITTLRGTTLEGSVKN